MHEVNPGINIDPERMKPMHSSGQCSSVKLAIIVDLESLRTTRRLDDLGSETWKMRACRLWKEHVMIYA